MIEQRREEKYENNESHKIHINKMRSPINRKRVGVHVGDGVCAGGFFGSCVLTCQRSWQEQQLSWQKFINLIKGKLWQM